MVDINGKEIKVGAVVKSDARKSAIYVVTELRSATEFCMQRVKKDRDYTLVPSRGYRVRAAQISELNFEVIGQKKDVCERVTTTSNNPTRRTLDDMATDLFMNKNIMREFFELIGELSPENLWCDGEASASEVTRKRHEIERKWGLLESYVGYSVSKEFPSAETIQKLSA